MIARRWAALAATLASAGVAGAALAPHLPVLLWNATASAPLGFYWLRPAADPAVGELVALRPPRPLALWLEAGGYVPAGVPLLKRVAAVRGQQVCRSGGRIEVDSQTQARALSHDNQGRVLPVWRGCRRLGEGEIFLLNAPPTSLDGRYFGPSRVSEVIGQAEPLWTWGEP